MKPHFLARSIQLLVAVAAVFLLTGTIFARKHDPSGVAKQSNVQFSLATSSDDLNVYGTASLTEITASNLSYRITITVTSPTGRVNTTQSDWSPAPVNFTTGLSLGDDDGGFNVQAVIESQKGTYDEYGNFGGKGTPSTIGNIAEVFLAPPRITISSFIFVPTPIFAIAGGNSSATATVRYSNGIAANTLVTFEMMDSPIGAGNPTYTVSTPVISPSSAGGEVSGTNHRLVRLTVPEGSPRSAQISFPFTLGQATGSGTVTADIFVNDIQPQPSPTVQVVPPTGVTATLIVQPTPTPPPTGGGGGQIDNCFCAGSAGLIPPGSGVCAGGSIPACPQGSFAGGGEGVCCWYNSPIVLDIDGNGFNMTSNENGVRFDVSGRGYATRTSWTAPNSDDAWLVLDRNENGRIDDGQEMFGDACPQPAGQAPRNGFSALAMFDQASFGGNGDGKITRRDSVFKKLRLWQDRNHNGISEAEELSSLPALDVVAIRLDYQESRRTDIHGNKFKYWAKVRDRADARVGRRAWDVFLVVAPPGQ